MANHEHLLIGIPSAGKTSYLAAFWHALRRTESSEAPLVVAELPPDRTYLNRICDEWLEGGEQDHTSSGEHEIELTIKHVDSDETHRLSVPDISGETYRRQFSQRGWDSDYRARAAEVSGAIVFLHPEHMQFPYAISDVNDVVGEAREPVDDGRSDETDSNDSLIAKAARAAERFDPQLSPAAVIVVDALQCLIHEPLQKTDLRVAVVVSAWDVIPSGIHDPAVWVERNAPILFQFLQTHCNEITHKFFGVSALGGDVRDPDVRSNLLEMKPSERIQVVGGGRTQIAAPILWLMEVT